MRTCAFLITPVVIAMAAASCSSGDNPYPGSCPPSIAKLDAPPLGTPTTGASALEEVTSFGESAGLKMYVHAPATAAAKTPRAVVLALHGCTQTARDYVNAGWNEVADREGDLVIVYGEQSATNNTMKCFRWWDAAQIGRSGEAQALANMVAAAHAKYGTKRAFVTGLSAGGAMTAVMLAAYPDVFEAGAIMAGLPYKCATSQVDAYTCMSGRAQSAEQWAALVPSGGSSPPRVSIWQGDADWTVRPANREELVKQWTKVNGVSATPDDTKTEGPAKHHVHRDANGVVRVESWEISKMGHGVALDAKSGGCGKAGAYALDVGLCSTTQAAAFFLGGSAGPTGASSSTGGPPTDRNPCP